MRPHNRGHKQGKNGNMVVRPYRYAVKYPCKVRYTSKAFKVFQDYMNWRYGNGAPFSMFGYVMSDHLYEASNRSGFMRRFLGEERRRFIKQRNEGCCGSHEFLAYRWNWTRMKHDIYLLGFNYGH